MTGSNLVIICLVCVCVCVCPTELQRAGVLSKLRRTRAERLQCCLQPHARTHTHTETKERGEGEKKDETYERVCHAQELKF